MSQREQAIQPWDLSSSVNDVSHSFILIPKVSAVSALSQLAAKFRVRVACKSGQLTHHRAQQNNSEPVWSTDAAGLAPFPQRNCRSPHHRSPPRSAAQNRRCQSRGYDGPRGWQHHDLDSSAAEIAAHAHGDTSICLHLLKIAKSKYV
jgi:hypothetical protein